MSLPMGDLAGCGGASIRWILDSVVNQSHQGASVDNTEITDLVFADNAVTFVESLEVLLMTSDNA